MSTAPSNPYPGEDATPDQIRQLANAYQKAADHVRQLGRRGKPLTYAPFRMTAIHAIELYLNAWLRHRGVVHKRIRGLLHNMHEAADLAREHDLQLSKGTDRNLRQIGEHREYLVSRYAPELSAPSQINRLEATLKEVAEEVTRRLDRETSTAQNDNQP